MTDADLSLCAFAEPDFGDFNELWQRAYKYLQREGFGILGEDAASDELAHRALAAMITVAPASPRSR